MELCVIDGCTRRARSRGWCGRHYEQWRRTGDPTVRPKPTRPSTPCSINGCGREASARSWCKPHYERWRLTGDPVAQPHPTVEQRFWSKVNKNGPVPAHAPELGPCWLWTAGKGAGGYGRFDIDGQWLMAHKVAKQLVGDPIPDGMVGDHRCFRHECVRPAHVREATRKQNAENRAPAPVKAKSGIKGVYPTRNGRWVVLVGHHGKLIYGGIHTDKEDAGQAAHDLRNRLFTHNDLDRITA